MREAARLRVKMAFDLRNPCRPLPRAFTPPWGFHRLPRPRAWFRRRCDGALLPEKRPRIVQRFQVLPQKPDPLFASRAWHSHYFHECVDLQTKLMRKGGPAPCSVRYVSGLLKRCATDKTCEPLARLIFLTHLLGNFRKSTLSLSPETRQRFYMMSTPELCSYLTSSLTTRQLHQILVNFVCSVTLEHSTLCSSIGADNTLACARSLETQTPLPPSQKLDSFALFSIMAKAVNIKRNNFRSMSRDRQAEFESIFDLLMQTRGRKFGITHSQLRTLGFTQKEIRVVGQCFSNVSRHTSLKSMRNKLRSLRPHILQKLTDIIWIQMQMMSVCVSALTRDRKGAEGGVGRKVPVQHDDAGVYHLRVPNNTVHGVNIPKTRVGTSMDHLTGRVTCGVCNLKSIIYINLIGNTIRIFKRRVYQYTIICCSMCARITSRIKTVGIYPVCCECEPSLRQSIRDRTRCPCRREGVEHDLIAEKDGQHIVYSLCSVHSHLAPDTIVSYDDLCDIIKHGK